MKAGPVPGKAAGTDKKAMPCVIVVFGITGDLAYRKILPAIYRLFSMGLLDERTVVAGVGRKKYSNNEYYEYIINAVSEGSGDSDEARKFAGMNRYICADFSEDGSFGSIRDELKKIAGGSRICNFLYYLSTPPQNFISIIEGIKASGLATPDFLDVSCAGSFVRVVIEKPYGSDLESARDLNGKVLSVFSEDQIFRIDHYLGKEAVQNIMVFRFLNGIFEPVWNHKYIGSVHVRVFETDGVGKRANYFDRTGIIRDIIQNHSLQMLSLVAMEPTVSMDPENIRDEKLKVLKSIRPFDPSAPEKFLLRGQYSGGKIKGESVRAYRDEPGVPGDSGAETFAMVKLFIDNWRWAGVPFYLSAGKRLAERATEVIVNFRPAPHLIFRGAFGDRHPAANRIIIRVQPDEGISLRIFSKAPGFEMRPRPVTMDFDYSSSFGQKLPEAYERLILDALNGDATLFMRSDEIEAAWEFISPILECSGVSCVPLKFYESGSTGPDCGDFISTEDRLFDECPEPR